MRYIICFAIGGILGAVYGTYLTMKGHEGLRKPVPVVPEPLNLMLEDLPATLASLAARCPEGAEGSIINNTGKLALLCEYPEVE